MSAYKTIRTILLSPKAIISICAITLAYIILSIYILNIRLLGQVLISNFPLTFKLSLLFNLLSGLWTNFSPLDIALLVLTGVLVGLNVYLAAISMKKLENTGKVHFSVGGAT